MKKYILIIAILCFWGCDTKKVEVIPEESVEYFSLNELDTVYNEKKLTSSDYKTRVFDELTKLQKKSSDENVIYCFNYQFYIGKNGKLEKIRPVNKMPELASEKSRIILNNEEQTNIIVKVYEENQFPKGIKNGKPVKYTFFHESMISFSNGNKSQRMNEPVSYDAALFFIDVEQSPEPVGGIGALQKKIVYPEIAKRAGIQGRIFIKAYIDENGDVVKAEVIKGIGAGCDEVALNAVKETKFKPGMQKGQPVKVQIAIPIVFKLQ